MNVKTPSIKIPSLTFRIEILVLLLLFILMTTCFTFQSCCKVDWYEGKQRLYATIEEFSNLNLNSNSDLEGVTEELQKEGYQVGQYNQKGQRKNLGKRITYQPQGHKFKDPYTKKK